MCRRPPACQLELLVPVGPQFRVTVHAWCTDRPRHNPPAFVWMLITLMSNPNVFENLTLYILRMKPKSSACKPCALLQSYCMWPCGTCFSSTSLQPRTTKRVDSETGTRRGPLGLCRVTFLCPVFSLELQGGRGGGASLLALNTGIPPLKWKAWDLVFPSTTRQATLIHWGPQGCFAGNAYALLSWSIFLLFPDNGHSPDPLSPCRCHAANESGQRCGREGAVWVSFPCAWSPVTHGIQHLHPNVPQLSVTKRPLGLRHLWV